MFTGTLRYLKNPIDREEEIAEGAFSDEDYIEVFDKETGKNHKISKAALLADRVKIAQSIAFSPELDFSQSRVHVDTPAGNIAFSLKANADHKIDNQIKAFLTLDGSQKVFFPHGSILHGVSQNEVLAAGTYVFIFSYNGTTIIVDVAAATIADAIAPELQTASTNSAGTEITLAYDEALDASIPAAADYVLTPAKTISNIAVSGQSVVLTVSVAFLSTDVITATYTKGANPIRDTSKNEASDFSNQAVTNNRTI